MFIWSDRDVGLSFARPKSSQREVFDFPNIRSQQKKLFSPK
jgi:hypothetical protein